VSALCRDCFADDAAKSARCRACGSPRIVRHDELGTLAIAHIDCDAFYATIEKRDDPSLTAEPVIVGGGRRGVVAAACYVARTYGVKSAMPMFEALRLCPHAHAVRPNMEKYSRVGREVRQMMLALTPLVEPLSIDEAFLDLSGTERLHGLAPAKVLARFASDVEGKLALTVSIGLSSNKFLAKIASDLDKPRGFAVLGATEAPAFLAPRPLSFIFGVGKASAARFARDGFYRIGDLQQIKKSKCCAATAKKVGGSPGLPAASIDAKSAPIAKPIAFRQRQPSIAIFPPSARLSAFFGRGRRRFRRD
jgi:DNA polymerase IV